MSATATDQQEAILTVEGLKTYYPIKRGILSRVVNYVKAVDDISFSIYPGETVGLVGESGCGKSTLGRSIVRLEIPREGRIMFQDINILRLSDEEMRKIRPKLQMIFQDPYSSLNPRKRICDILAEPLKAHRLVAEDKIDDRVNELLHMVGLPPGYKNRYPHEFSGGQRQRIGIARALALNPQLIVCDEPVSALDVSIQAQILNLLKELQQEFKLTYLFISHGLGAVRYICDRIMVMYLGKIVESGETEEIFSHPKHPYTKALLSSQPIPNPKVRSKDRIILQGDVPNPTNPPSGCRFHTRCPIKKDICQKKEPVLTGDGHKVACFALE